MKTDKEILREISIEIINTIEATSGGDSERFRDMLEIVRAASRLADLKAIFEDMLEWSQDTKEKDLLGLDLRLIDKGLPTLTQMRNKDFKSFLKILTNGSIRNESEYRLVDKYLSDMVNENIPKVEIGTANRLIARYHRTTLKNVK